MTLWHYAVGSEEKGPIDETELLALVRTGALAPDTLVWRSGRGDWMRIADTPELIVEFEPEQPASEQRHDALPPIPSLPLARPWARFWATSLDLALLFYAANLMLTFAVLLLLPWPVLQLYYQEWRIAILVAAVFVSATIAVVLRAVIMALFGTSPGKALFGIRVVQLNGQSRGLFHLTRELMMWLKGLALHIFPLFFVTLILQYRRVAHGEPAGHDRGRARVEGRRISGTRFAAGVVVALLTPVALGKAMDPAATWMVAALTPPPPMQTFVNPVTGRQATFEAAWVVENLSRDNMLFAISSDQAGGGMYFGHEQIPATMDERQYAEVLAELQARAGYEASADWAPVMINGQGAMRLAMKSTKEPDTTAEITIALRGRDAWRMVTFLMEGKKRDEAFAALEAAVFRTIE
ncbi:RDD family protein [Ensifer sp. PDNC004]|uniref:RDD family protein n=1 Tax=Ensifer sp. PDNC004 TaxID=2811423 RepID=UPI00196371BE|nr:RDD family protein [Ensifer sp. PDNC004]QRY68685.1 RDD family protein [Ensifer sp. PDNC004]